MAISVALGLKAHSGWAALVALAEERGELSVAARRRLELIEPADAEWAKQPYHAAEGLDPDEARGVVARGIESAQRIALRELRAAIAELETGGHRVVSCAVLLGTPMPEWSVDEILAVHFRMHKAEGELFRDALARAAGACGTRFVGVSENTLPKRFDPALRERIAALGKSVGPPWGKDQKEAALAAWLALRS
jgi:hypothetical protein